MITHTDPSALLFALAMAVVFFAAPRFATCWMALRRIHSHSMLRRGYPNTDSNIEVTREKVTRVLKFSATICFIAAVTLAFVAPRVFDESEPGQQQETKPDK